MIKLYGYHALKYIIILNVEVIMVLGQFMNILKYQIKKLKK